jgi:hypothetical protein
MSSDNQTEIDPHNHQSLSGSERASVFGPAVSLIGVGGLCFIEKKVRWASDYRR